MNNRCFLVYCQSTSALLSHPARYTTFLFFIGLLFGRNLPNYRDVNSIISPIFVKGFRTLFSNFVFRLFPISLPSCYRSVSQQQVGIIKDFQIMSRVLIPFSNFSFGLRLISLFSCFRFPCRLDIGLFSQQGVILSISQYVSRVLGYQIPKQFFQTSECYNS
jgi:hypothetical protein